MRGVASVAVAVAATLSVDVSAAPAKLNPNGREQTHFAGQHSFDVLDNLRRHLGFPHSSELWPPFGQNRPDKGPDKGKVANGGGEELHVELQHLLYFFGADMWQHWAFAHFGALWSPNGLNSEGFTLKVLLNGGAYRYVSSALNNSTILGRQSSMAIMPGWRFKRASYEVTFYVGIDLQQFITIPFDPGAGLRGRYYGIRGGFELWHEPSPTTMLAADASLSSIGAGNSARAAFGWRLLDRFYLGPEAQVYSTDNYVHKRVGVHITAFKIDGREWSGAAGLASDNDNRSGIYLRVGELTRR